MLVNRAMRFLESLADQRIQEAIERGDLDNLPGAGRPIPAEPELSGVAPELRIAYRILKNAGMLPEEVQIRREIGEITQLMQELGGNAEAEERLARRVRFLLQKLGESRGGNLMLESAYYPAIVKRIESNS
ncbi:MAG: DnaJ family domain-containing protein [Gammaproteobacteria bacterium]